MSELRECPFCGGEVKLDADDFYMFCCDKCGAGITFAKVFEDGTAGGCSKDESITAWNRRAQPDNAPLTLDELRGMDGEPVYIVGRLYGGWTVPWRNAAKYIARCPDEANISHYPKDYGKTWLAYRRPPERSENDGL